MITHGKGKMLARLCKDCQKRYVPLGPFSRFCDKCLKKPEHTGGNIRKHLSKSNGKYFFQNKKVTTKKFK